MRYTSLRLPATVVLLLNSINKAFAQVNLGTAGSFGIVANQAITNTGQSVVSGSMGLFPNPETSITGFPPGISGDVYAANGVADRAIQDAQTAYTDAMNQESTATISGADLGGQTFVAGTYTSGSAIQITGTVTLNAENNPNALFVFQIGSSLTTASSSRVVLANGARACNVYWQVGSSATLGTGSSFFGNILSQASISLQSGVSVDGGLYALTGAVTLINDNVRAQGTCTTQATSSAISSTPSTTPATTDTASTDTASTVPGTTDTDSASTVPGTTDTATGGGDFPITLPGGGVITTVTMPDGGMATITLPPPGDTTTITLPDGGVITTTNSDEPTITDEPITTIPTTDFPTTFPTGNFTRPTNTGPLTQPTGPLTQPTIPLTQPTGPLTQPTLPVTQPTLPVTQPVQFEEFDIPETETTLPETQPFRPFTVPDQSETQSTLSTQSTSSTTQSTLSTIQSTLTSTEPDLPVTRFEVMPTESFSLFEFESTNSASTANSSFLTTENGRTYYTSAPSTTQGYENNTNSATTVQTRPYYVQSRPVTTSAPAEGTTTINGIPCTTLSYYEPACTCTTTTIVPIAYTPAPVPHIDITTVHITTVSGVACTTTQYYEEKCDCLRTSNVPLQVVSATASIATTIAGVPCVTSKYYEPACGCVQTATMPVRIATVGETVVEKACIQTADVL